MCSQTKASRNAGFVVLKPTNNNSIKNPSHREDYSLFLLIKFKTRIVTIRLRTFLRDELVGILHANDCLFNKAQYYLLYTAKIIDL